MIQLPLGGQQKVLREKNHYYNNLKSTPIKPLIKDELCFGNNQNSNSTFGKDMALYFAVALLSCGAFKVSGVADNIRLKLGLDQPQQNPVTIVQQPTAPTAPTAPQAPLAPQPQVTQPPAPPVDPGPTREEAQSILNTGKYGHLPYNVASESVLVQVTGGVKLERNAAEAFERMVTAAKNDGITLSGAAGFRTIDDQTYLFDGIRRERGQTPEERAKSSAPPGYSEHHTGYAVDIKNHNGENTNTDFSADHFVNTDAFRWLQQHAQEYGFELSFKEGNPQGVMFEAWHWRFVGSQEAQQTFQNARRLQEAHEKGVI